MQASPLAPPWALASPTPGVPPQTGTAVPSGGPVAPSGGAHTADDNASWSIIIIMCIVVVWLIRKVK